ncbi:phosphatase PAP2 family protein [Actinoplanes sp. N902-109]|uniref:phosphatase PAP2 family protein n=1 Tax=Actinoplanes sp. (strain N902-109) TaxID=649831 RepID=UPI0018DB05A7|nr:phosphatase PAP2 family protein [Actinoplanes sp. N902-109]
MNYQLFHLINGPAGRFDAVDDAMEFAATWLIVAMFAVGAGLVVFAVHQRRIRPVVELAVALFFAFAAATAVSHLSSELRPFQSHHVHQLIAHDPGVSLPSDHATAAFTLAFGVCAFLHRGWGIVLLVAALAVGISRIWVGVHYPGDILAAVVIAGLAVLATWLPSRSDPRREAQRR